MLHKYLILFILVVAAACNTNKKNTATTNVNDEPAILLDTLTVLANKPVEKEIYRASNPRSNDLIHTKLEVDFDWTACRMNGRATLQLKPYFYPVSDLYLDARGMEIKKLEVFEIASVKEEKKVGNSIRIEVVDIWNRVTASTYEYENDSIKIHLGRSFTSNDNYYVVIDYVAKPNELKKEGGSAAITDDKGLYFVNPTGENPYKMPQIWTQGETQASSVWFPTIDSPNERMTQEIFMTVDDRYTTLSNGVLVKSEKKENGKRIDHWKLDLPHAPYLAMMAVGEFKKVIDEPWEGKEVSYYVEKEYEAYAKEIFGETKEMIDFYSKKLGVPYAWPKYAQIVARDYVSGAMENTSATLHGDFMVYQTRREMVDGVRGTAVIAHELFHQWFGDLVTCESWSNLPLNESFATYGEYLWEEYKNGRDAADNHSWQSRQGYIHSDKEANLIRFDYKDKEDMFDAISYNKGGQILHMLRKAVGDDAFFASLKNYLETNKFKAVEVHNLRLAFEETTGKDLNWFFNQWFLNKGRPKLKVSVAQNAAGVVELFVEQTQDLKNAPLYTLPIDIDIYDGKKVKRTRIIVNEQKQRFLINNAVEIKLLNFDAERQLLADIEYVKDDETYVFQYKNAPLFGDRLEALKGLEKAVSDSAIFNLFAYAAQNDKSPQLRMYAIGKLEKVDESRAAQLKTLLIKCFTSDNDTRTRAKSLEVLNNRFGKDLDVKVQNQDALKEQSYAICGQALQMLSKHDPILALQYAKQLEDESGKDVLFPIAALYATHGGEEQMPFFHKSIKYYNGFEIMSFCALYAKAAKRSNQSDNAINAVKDFELLGIGANKYVKFAALKGMKDILGVWETKEKVSESALNMAKSENKSIVELEKQHKEIKETREIINKMYERSK